jgi:hypothetical protein
MFGRSPIKPPFAVIATSAALAIVAAAVFASLALGNGSSTKTVTVRPCGDRIFGHIGSLERSGESFVLRFDPAWFTSGVTANTAAAEDTGGDPSQPVPNDNYVVDESHRLLTYVLPATTPVTILTRDGTGPLGESQSSVSELDAIVNGGEHRELFESLESGVWIRVHIDTVCSLDQQYRP